MINLQWYHNSYDFFNGGVQIIAIRCLTLVTRSSAPPCCLTAESFPAFETSTFDWFRSISSDKLSDCLTVWDLKTVNYSRLSFYWNRRFFRSRNVISQTCRSSLSAVSFVAHRWQGSKRLKIMLFRLVTQILEKFELSGCGFWPVMEELWWFGRLGQVYRTSVYWNAKISSRMVTDAKYLPIYCRSDRPLACFSCLAWELSAQAERATGTASVRKMNAGRRMTSNLTSSRARKTLTNRNMTLAQWNILYYYYYQMP